MKTKDVQHYIRVSFDLDCDWDGLPPVYRIYVEGELFAEREWCWTEHYTQEILQIQATPGVYVVELAVVRPSLAKFRTSNHKVEHGNAIWIDDTRIKIPLPTPIVREPNFN